MISDHFHVSFYTGVIYNGSNFVHLMKQNYPVPDQWTHIYKSGYVVAFLNTRLSET